MLPSPPSLIDLVFEGVGSFPVSLVGYKDEAVCFYGPRQAVRAQMQLSARGNDQRGGGHELELRVAESCVHTGEQALAQATVTAVRRRMGRRLAARITVGEKATAQVAFSSSLPVGAGLDVRVVDASATDLAFSTPQPLDPGDPATW